MRLANSLILALAALAAGAGAAVADPCCGLHRAHHQGWAAPAIEPPPAPAAVMRPVYVESYGRPIYAEPTPRAVYFNEPSAFDARRGRAVSGQAFLCGRGCVSAAY